MANHEERSDGFTAIEDRYANYEVYDRNGDKIGRVDDLFVDETDRPEYIGVKMGFLGLRSTLIPWELVTPGEGAGRLTVATDKETAKNGPAFDDDREITPEYEEQVYSHYGLTRTAGATGSSGYGDYYGADGTTETMSTTSGTAGSGTVGTGMTTGDTESGRFEPHGPGQEGPGRGDDKSDLEEEDELRVRRSEEELRAGTREREAGRVNVRKRVRTDRERIEVPTRREEVSVERVPVNEEGTGVEIGDDEVSVPVTEEEVVVEKRPVVKEEVRVRKDVVEGTEVVEEDVRREEVDVEDATETRRLDT